ncbi:hypothetical protein G7Y79_00047g083610 [Physcia stellaris]|nr:hypothetical protein G7Y79_00047g083610 [Physcia stellaris]
MSDKERKPLEGASRRESTEKNISNEKVEGFKFNCVLENRLGAALPHLKSIKINHISSEPERCESLYSQAPSQPAEETYREKHFLLASVQHIPSAIIPVYGLEVIVYTTAQLTTIFVSKADSTGFMHLVQWPKWASSPMTTIASVFLRLLADVFQKPNKRLVVSLFARSQHTYLFPGSGDNDGKNVLSDSALIRWWARVMNLVMDLDQPEHDDTIEQAQRRIKAYPATSQVYLRVPGCSAAETKRFVPGSLNDSSPFRSVSLAADPFELLAPRADLPARCMIPHFYDDPKTRFADELDGYDKLKSDGNWSSVTSLDGFWDLMQYRQECAAGKLVGFVWGVFTPSEIYEKEIAHPSSPSAAQGHTSTTDPTASDEKVPNRFSSIFDESTTCLRNPGPNLGGTASALSLEQAQRVILSEKSYDDAQTALAKGDFSDKMERGELHPWESSMASMQSYVDHVCSLAEIKNFGYLCEGKMPEPEVEEPEPNDEKGEAANDQRESKEEEAGSRKRRAISDLTGGNDETKPKSSPVKPRNYNHKETEPVPINVLSSGMIRKKPKPNSG